MRQIIVIGCLFLTVTIAVMFNILNSFTLHRTSTHGEPQSISNLEYCQKYNGQTADVKKIFSTLSKHLPAEDQWDELLKQADTKGALLTHDVALKTREYSSLFQPWADLHISMGDHASYSREDVVQFLHCQAGAAATQVAGNMNQSQILQTVQLYDSYKYLVASMGQTLFPWTAPYFPDHLSLYLQIKNGGRGIVFTAGNKQVSYILTSIVTIRKLGCTLPIEVLYLGATDLSPTMRQKIESFPNVVTRNLEHMIHTGNDWKFEGFDMKPFAMLVSSFREAILVDADVGFLKNPESLFLDWGYVETGTLFFYDRIHNNNDDRNEWVRAAMPKPFSDRFEKKFDLSEKLGPTRSDQESGVVVFDKSKHFISLLLIAWLNGPNRHGSSEPVIDKGFYEVYYGDKDSFWFGMELAGNPDYSFSTGALASTGNLTKIVQYTGDQNSKDAIKIDEHAYNSPHADGNSKQDLHMGRTISTYDRDVKVCSYQMVHMDRDQSPLWYNGWISDEKKPSLLMRNVWQFEHYMVEDPVLNGNNPWSWLGGFKGCLDGRELVSFTDSEKRTFQQAIQAAIDLGIVQT
jgi:alpha 1,3-mannosyltransferase